MMTDQPHQGDPGTQVLSVRIDEVCDRFEAAWKAAATTGCRPRIEDYLETVLEDERPALLQELVPLDAYYRRLAGDNPQTDDYKAHFPALDTAWLADALAPSLAEPAGPATSQDRGARRLRCPHCHNPIRLTDDHADEVLCPACGSAFRADSAQAEMDEHGNGDRPGEKTKCSWPSVVGYEILGELGRGGMGVVYKALQISLDRLVAIKVLPPSSGQLPSFARRFVREARALGRLNHPHIVAVHDFGAAQGLYYFVMEYVDGMSLRQLLRSRPPTAAVALDLFGQLCDGLGYAHDEGVAHRDLKPENLLLDRRGRLKIADFGLAKLLREAGDTGDSVLTESHQCVGTYRYMAPEQIERPQEVDHRADIYALGLVLHELLTGELPTGPFRTPAQTVDVKSSLDGILRRMLERDPRLRPQHLREVVAALRPAGGSQGAGAGRSTPPKLVFRMLLDGNSLLPAESEVYVRPSRAEHQGRRDLAVLVLEHGVEALVRGPGLAERVVVDASGTRPTLDDLLAATFAARLLAGQRLPEGCRAFAQYAALAREGLRPSNVPLEASLEGIYLALRNAAGPDVTDPAVGERFRADWSRLEESILRAAAAGRDPFTAPPFESGAEFARERAFLARDREVYRQDVSRGERWLVRLPEGPPQAGALLLRRPKSLLFKHWCRADTESPAGQCYLFLAVDWDGGNWVFSTDPVHRLPLRSLAQTLQEAEAAADPTRAGANAWFDGEPFGYTLVAAPRGGTSLAEERVLQIVKAWAGVRAPEDTQIGPAAQQPS
jgi:hypothetical protein